MKDVYSYDFYKVSADYIKERIDFTPEIGIILGSCLGPIGDEIKNKTVIKYKDIPNFLQTTVKSHKGEYIFGELAGKKVICMSGRFHYYEGYEMNQLQIPIRVMKLLGVKTVILTNAAGGINESFKAGDIMLIKDHINLTGLSPVRGPNISEFGPRFFDMSEPYDREYMDLARKAAKDLDIDLKEGVYYYATGPQFETAAEIRAMRSRGGDAVGMSTVTETIVAAHCGIKVLALSLITNMATGVLKEPVSTEEIDRIAENASIKFRKLVKKIVEDM